jgi:SAM-dependent methyltransferase
VLDSPLDFRAVWERKSVLREIYVDIYRRIAERMVDGRTLELGSGSGDFKAFVPTAVSSDILVSPWLDLVCDAQRLPFPGECFANIVMVDVLHHLESPLFFFREAERVLRRGGRLIFCEPAITPLSRIFYRLFHREPCDMSIDPLQTGTIRRDRDPYDSNQAIPTLLVTRHRDVLARTVPELSLQQVDWISFWAYPLSGGFQRWSVLPAVAARPLLRLEWRLRRHLGPLAAFRLLAVYEKAR